MRTLTPSLIFTSLLLFTAMFLVIHILSPAAVHGQSEVSEDMQTYAARAVEWLAAQQVPNAIEPDPYPTRRHLPIGYQIPQRSEEFRYIGRRSYTYDAAIAAVAFSAAGEYPRAENILLALGRLTDESGQLWFAYNTNNAWPNEADAGGAVVRTGTVAWAGYAATFYLRMTADRPVAPADRRIRDRILDLARRTARYVTDRQITDTGDPRYGLATGGHGSYELEVNEEGDVVEVYDPAELSWTSVEHNIDAYFLLRDLYHLTGEVAYREAAAAMGEGLESLWSPEAEQLIRGVNPDRTRDDVLPLDTASWGAMFFLARENRERAEATLEAVDRRFLVERDGHAGYIPYGNSSVYENDAINEFYFGDPDATWGDVAPLWMEGSLGVATAHGKAGNQGAAQEIVEAMHAYRHDNGGFQYADREVPHQFTTYRSVASTAWYVLAVAVLENEEVRRLFWSG